MVASHRRHSKSLLNGPASKVSKAPVASCRHCKEISDDKERVPGQRAYVPLYPRLGTRPALRRGATGLSPVLKLLSMPDGRQPGGFSIDCRNCSSERAARQGTFQEHARRNFRDVHAEDRSLCTAFIHRRRLRRSA